MPLPATSPVAPASAETLVRAARLLHEGELVAFPTETVYGLGADAGNPAAVAKIFAAKGRPADHPVIVHVADINALAFWVRTIPDGARRLLARFSPGPLTLILPRAHHVSDVVTGGQDSVGLRIPSHPVAQALLRTFADMGGHGIAAPSANRFGHVSPTTAQHVADDLGERLALIIDGGACEHGIESTIIAFTDDEAPLLLRPGSLSIAILEEALGQPLSPPVRQHVVPRASGTLASHYAPNTPTQLVDAHDLPAVARHHTAAGKRVAALLRTLNVLDHAAHVLTLPITPAAYAHGLYAALRALDSEKDDILLIERVPDTPEWLAVRDRLGRAATPAGDTKNH